MFRILVAEDDESSRRLFCEILQQNGFDPLPAEDGEQAMALLDRHFVDLIVLDVMMPRMDGFQFLRQLRSCGSTIPVLIVTARQTLEDKWQGFESGSDDYMVKPVDTKELVLRIRALLRRTQIASQGRLQLNGLELNHDDYTVTWQGRQTELPKKEFQLLFKLLSSPGKIYTKRQLMDEIWDFASDSDEHTVEVHIGRLRERFRDCDAFEIVTVRGLGYKAVKHEAE